MTRDEILNMPAGREMDVLVAEKLSLYVKPGALKAGDHYIKTDQNGYFGTPYYCRPFSTDISAAWEVVEKMYIHSLRKIVNDEPDRPALWQAHIYADSTLSGIAETAPLAICRAALLAVMEQITQQSPSQGTA